MQSKTIRFEAKENLETQVDIRKNPPNLFGPKEEIWPRIAAAMVSPFRQDIAGAVRLIVATSNYWCRVAIVCQAAAAGLYCTWKSITT